MSIITAAAADNNCWILCEWRRLEYRLPCSQDETVSYNSIVWWMCVTVIHSPLKQHLFYLSFTHSSTHSSYCLSTVWDQSEELAAGLVLLASVCNMAETLLSNASQGFRCKNRFFVNGSASSSVALLWSFLSNSAAHLDWLYPSWECVNGTVTFVPWHPYYHSSILHRLWGHVQCFIRNNSFTYKIN